MGADKPGRKKPPIRQPQLLDMQDERVVRVLNMAFAGRYTVAKMAESVSLSARTIARWVKRPEFQAALEAKSGNLNASLEGVTFADKAKRILALNDAALIALTDLEERPKLKEVRPTKDGFITNEAFNNAAMAEFRAALADIAAEKGERKQKVEMSGTLDVNTLASEADAKFRAFLATLTAGRVLGQPDARSEG